MGHYCLQCGGHYWFTNGGAAPEMDSLLALGAGQLVSSHCGLCTVCSGHSGLADHGVQASVRSVYRSRDDTGSSLLWREQHGL